MAVADIALAEIQPEENDDNWDSVTVQTVKYYSIKSKRPLRAIRYFCFKCMGWEKNPKGANKPIRAVKNCPNETCPLFDF